MPRSVIRAPPLVTAALPTGTTWAPLYVLYAQEKAIKPSCVTGT